MEKSETIKELATALAKAQAELGHAKKDSVNPHFKSRYSDISEVIDTIKPVFTKYGLSFLQMPSYEGNLLTLTTMLLHVSGEWIAETAKTPISKQDPQGVGAGITYLRRFALSAFSGLAQEDDDGNTASQNTDRAQAKGSPQQSSARPMAPVVNARADQAPPMSDDEVTSVAFSLDDDTPDWMKDEPSPAPQEENKTYCYRLPFDMKDQAKGYGCSWNKPQKTWDSKNRIEAFDRFLIK